MSMVSEMVKGKTLEISVSRLLRERTRLISRLRVPEYNLPIVGRTEELEQITRKLDLASQGKGQILGITSEAG